MKKKAMLAALVAGALVRASVAANPCYIELPGLADLGASVDSVEVIEMKQLDDEGEDYFVTTNRWTPAEGPYSTATLMDAVRLVANLKPGYQNARFAYETQAWGEQEAVTGFLASGAYVPFYTADNLGNPVALATTVTALLVDPMQFTLTLDGNGAVVKPSSCTLTYDQPYGALPEPAREGYHFLGWTGDGRTWTGEETVKTLTNQTFTAAWEPLVYTVRFDATEGTGAMADLSCTYGVAQKLPVCTFTRANYVFNCWSNTVSGVCYGDGEEIVNLAAQQDAVVRLAAVWAAKTYSVNYHPNDEADVVSQVAVNYGATIELKGALGRLGYTFLGWATTPTAKRPEYSGYQSVDTSTFDFNARGECHLYAVWAPYYYTVTFAAGGGTGAMEAVGREFDDGEALPPCGFARTGYAFDGWRSNTGMTYADGSTENLSWQSGVTVALTAVWRPIEYTVEFDANDAKATGEMAALDLVWARTQKLPACAFAKDGYDFVGWAREAEGDVVFADGETVGNLTETDGVAVTLYARWKAQTYIVVLDANGGVFGTKRTDPALSNLTVTVDAPYGDFPAVVNLQPKLVFGAWCRATGEEVACDDLVPPPSAGVTNLVARWVKDDPLARAVDAEELDFDWSSTWGLGRWIEEKEPSEAADGDAACAVIDDAGDQDILTMTTQVVGPGTLTFQWKILSNSQPWKPSATPDKIWRYTPERLFFDVGSTRLLGLAGSSTRFYRITSFKGEEAATLESATTNPGWVEETVQVDAEPGVTNTLTWTFHYVKDDPVPGKAWVNAVKWEAAGTGEDAELRSLLGLSQGAASVDYDLTVSAIACTADEVRVAVSLARSEDGVAVVNRAVRGVLKLYAAAALDGPWEALAAEAANGTFAAGETATFTVPRSAGTAPVFFKAALEK